MKPILFTEKAKEAYKKLEGMFKKQPETAQVMSFASIKEEVKAVKKDSKKEQKVAKLLTPVGLKE